MESIFETEVPPHSPVYDGIGTESIVTHTHREGRSQKTNGDVWHDTHPPKTSADEAAATSSYLKDSVLMQSNGPPPTSPSPARLSGACVLDCLSKGGHAQAGSNSKEAFHVHVAPVLSSSIGRVDQATDP